MLTGEDNARWNWHLREVRYAGEQGFVTFAHSMNERDTESFEVSTEEADRLRSHIGKRGTLRFMVDEESNPETIESWKKRAKELENQRQEARAERGVARKQAEAAEAQTVIAKRFESLWLDNDVIARAEKAEGVVREVRELAKRGAPAGMRVTDMIQALGDIAKLVAEPDQTEPVKCGTCGGSGRQHHPHFPDYSSPCPDCTKPEHDPSCECLGTDRGDEHDSDCPAYKSEPVEPVCPQTGCGMTFPHIHEKPEPVRDVDWAIAEMRNGKIVRDAPESVAYRLRDRLQYWDPAQEAWFSSQTYDTVAKLKLWGSPSGWTSADSVEELSQQGKLTLGKKAAYQKVLAWLSVRAQSSDDGGGE